MTPNIHLPPRQGAIWRVGVAIGLAAAGMPAPAQTPQRPAATPAPAPATQPATAQPPRAQPIPRATFIADMDRQFRGMDSNNDGMVTTVEARAAQQREAAAAARARAAASFQQLDRDRSGQLNLDEFAEFVRATTNLPLPHVLGFDSNRDGRVTLIEYRTGTQGNFDKLDADRDGIVSIPEMRAGGIIR